MTALGLAAFIVAVQAATIGVALHAIGTARHLRRRVHRVEEQLTAAYLRGTVIRRSPDRTVLMPRDLPGSFQEPATSGDDA